MSQAIDKTRLVAFSQLMLVYAEQARWEELQTLEQEFNQLAKTYFGAQTDEALAKQLLAQNEQIQTILKAEQAKISQQHAKDLKNTKAMHSYLKSS